ncbi:hypothetical protein [Dokdonella sp.]|uniref:hypothetical protein n=1 Tax=Dokdonella sp. TaxID=2291710 RepID=UPI0025B7B320|nr:hypothetical protein [Dokdonella sp.]
MEVEAGAGAASTLRDAEAIAGAGPMPGNSGASSLRRLVARGLAAPSLALAAARLRGARGVGDASPSAAPAAAADLRGAVRARGVSPSPAGLLLRRRGGGAGVPSSCMVEV